ncbi:MAG: L-histidine N(alpha)-methyltransferase, partial [Cenarchaeum sp. SB0669_bin_11]|nr:L-histidine N(alpha)-methyltransferase [Cenarchaeum sp. SB0669_bin_11]
NKSEKRIEMYLKSEKDQSVDKPGANTTLYLKKDELIHTENSQKYTIPHIQTMADSVNLKIKRIWHDATKKFSVTLMST